MGICYHPLSTPTEPDTVSGALHLVTHLNQRQGAPPTYR